MRNFWTNTNSEGKWNMRTRLGILVGLLGAQLCACGAPAPLAASPPQIPPPAPKPAPPAAAEPSAASQPIAAPAPAPAAADSTPAPESKPEPEAEERPSRPPVEILTAPDTAFLLNYSGSAPSDAARKACSERPGVDDEAIAQCMSKAREAFRPDVLRFKKDGSHWSCVIYKRNGSRLDEVYSARTDLTEDAPNRVKLKFTGAERGARPLLKSKREIVIVVPNDYSFVLTDPDLGQLIYEAKIGLVGS
jgi:hypothetical protein